VEVVHGAGYGVAEAGPVTIVIGQSQVIKLGKEHTKADSRASMDVE
jgi:hypothetical protein